MITRQEVASLSSLAAVKQGDEVLIQEFLFDSVRAHCQALEMATGDRVQCRAAGRAAILLVTPSGRCVSLDPDWARFIKVTHP